MLLHDKIYTKVYLTFVTNDVLMYTTCIELGVDDASVRYLKGCGDCVKFK